MNIQNAEIEEEVENEEIIDTEVDEVEGEVSEVEEETEEEEEIHDDFKDLGEKAKVKAQKRFNKMTAKNYKLLEEVTEANNRSRASEDRFAAIELKLSGGNTVEAPVETAVKPTRDDFDDEDEWIEALTEFKTDQKINKTLKAMEAKNTKAKIQKEQQEYETNTIDNFKTKSREAMELHEDYLDVTSNVPINLESDLGKEILDSKEHGASIMYALGQDPDLFDKIKNLSGKQLSSI